MSLKFTILGCGSSMGVPRPDGYFGKCNPNNLKNYRTRCSAILQTKTDSVLIDTSPDLRTQLIKNKINNIDKVLYSHMHADQTHGINDLRVFYIKKRKPINENEEGLRVVVSRSHMSEETSEYVNKLTRPKLISCGSSLKFLYIADNKADIYPRFGPTMEWDTAAAHSILNALEIHVINLDTGRELSYNKENLLNPYFIIKA